MYAPTCALSLFLLVPDNPSSPHSSEDNRSRFERLRSELVHRAAQLVRPTPRMDPSDLAQQTLLEGLKQTQHEEDAPPPSGWFRQLLGFQIASRWRWLYRKRRDIRRERPLDGGPGEPTVVLSQDQTSPSERMVAQERREGVLAAVRALPADQREAVELRFFEGLSVPEIAERMERSKDAVGSLLYRAIRNLQNRLNASEQSV